jgi:hypothetical protein
MVSLAAFLASFRCSFSTESRARQEVIDGAPCPCCASDPFGERGHRVLATRPDQIEDGLHVTVAALDAGVVLRSSRLVEEQHDLVIGGVAREEFAALGRPVVDAEHERQRAVLLSRTFSMSST